LKGELIYEIYLFENHHIVTIKKNGVDILNFIDTLSSENPKDLTTFTRELTKSNKKNQI
jgi:hypothetical protein